MNNLDKIASLRNLISSENIDAILFYGTDPNLSEYVPLEWRTIEWISGFTGSSAKVVITKNKAALWTDSRYFIQAETQLKNSEFVMIKDRQSDTISVEQWLLSELDPGNTVSIDGRTVSASEAMSLKQKLSAKSILLETSKDLLSRIWHDRPVQQKTPVYDYPVNFAGQSRQEKLTTIRRELKINGADSLFINQLDDLAWTFNLRGKEIEYNPVFAGYGYINHEEAFLFVENGRISKKLIETLRTDGIFVFGYESLFPVLDQNMSEVIYLDPDRTNSVIYGFLSSKCHIIDGTAIPALLKSVKNKIEISGMKAAHRRDGVAMVNFLYWFYKYSHNEVLTEISIAQKLKEFRSEQKNFVNESFSPIISYGSHGAIVHYSATPETNAEIKPDGILLLDTGAQYLDGTTDITRTIATGKVSSYIKTDFTLVLKGMINLAKAKFPYGTKGHSLDIFARKYLWSNRLNYGHGTGHGVGHFLSVHEGPMSIRTEFNNHQILPGQIITDEPGLYRQDKYGIRIENVLVCKNDGTSEFGTFLTFDTLTLCPIDRKLIKRKLLNNDEINWINKYHKRVLTLLKPYLKQEILKWLTDQCAPI